MYIRKFSFLFFIFSILAGIVGFVSGEYLYQQYYGILPNVVLVGLYFGQLALFVGLFCLLAEVLSPVINGRSWRMEYVGLSWKVLVPATFGLLFLTGMLFQFLYSLNITTIKPPNDIVLALDISGSMEKSDKERKSLEAAKQLMMDMDQSHRAAVITFNNDASITQPMFKISQKSELTNAVNGIDQLEPSGGTDIGKALDTAMEHMKENKKLGRKPTVILFSDGYSDFDVASTLASYKRENITVNTIGMSRFDLEGASLLRKIARETDGYFYDIKNADELKAVFKEIYIGNQDRLLISDRQGMFKDSLYLATLRVLFITIIGALMGLALGMIFDNRYLAKSYAIGGIVSGLIAGFILELGLENAPFLSFIHRGLADVVLAVVIGFGSLMVPVKEKFSGSQAAAERPSRKGFTKKDPLKKGF
ncbi:VWA domain-containing protein [Bacillus sp. CGMCC 1.16607]|uniref:vWA domain-containing protein n=1 Tax=Bacillus sp. CGMCC 1.16607 TaxID=3351842 RepID=UPI003629C6FE